MPTATLASGLTLSYRTQGDAGAPAVVLVPGPTDSWRSYGPVVPGLAEHLRVVAVSPRGHGESDKPRHGYRVEELADDVRFLLDALGIERALLAGHSGSCPVVRRVALDRPDRVAGLVLEAAPTTLRGHPPFVEFVAEVVSDLHDPISAELARSFVADTSTTDLAPELRDALVADVLAVPAHVWRAMFGALAEYDDAAELPALRVPVLLLWGEVDPLVPRSMQDRLRQTIPDAELVVYAGVGHTPRWEVPDRFAADVVAFARRIGDLPA